MLTNSQIDKLGERLRVGEMDADCLRSLEQFRAQFAPAYKFVENVLVDKMALKITGRPSKSTVAIVEKLRRETIRLNQMQDIAGCRVLVDGLNYQDRLVKNMVVMLGDVRIDDKRDDPKHGYRAIHLVVSAFGRPVEVQVRTTLQHAWANLSEKMADDVGHSIKYGEGDVVALIFLQRLSEITAKLELIRRQKALVSARKKTHKKSKEMITEAKRLSVQERGLLRDMRSLFEGR